MNTPNAKKGSRTPWTGVRMLMGKESDDLASKRRQ